MRFRWRRGKEASLRVLPLFGRDDQLIWHFGFLSEEERPGTLEDCILSDGNEQDAESSFDAGSTLLIVSTNIQ